MRESAAKLLYSLFPFDLRGDCEVPAPRDGVAISCIINFYGRLDLLRGILSSLSQQNFSRESFEVVLVEDRGGTEGGSRIASEFSHLLPIVYAPLDRNFGSMGYSRNFGLAVSRGEYTLFLDDDTVLLQEDFLQRLHGRFLAHPEVDALVPHGQAAFALIRGRYDFHDPYFMTSRCTAYRRSILAELGGFCDHFTGQEDVEFVIRFLLAGRKSLNVSELNYYHPPLLVGRLTKPMSVGRSFYRLKGRYPFLLWVLAILNCSRHAPLWLLPGRKNREMGRFGIGFIAGVLTGWTGGKGPSYS